MSNPRLRFSPELIHPDNIYKDSKDDSFLKMLTCPTFPFILGDFLLETFALPPLAWTTYKLPMDPTKAQWGKLGENL